MYLWVGCTDCGHFQLHKRIQVLHGEFSYSSVSRIDTSRTKVMLAFFLLQTR